MSRSGPLSGVRVLELSRLLPGAYATLLMADLGADVIKIEERERGDYMRWVGPMSDDDMSAIFSASCRNKRSITLDLKKLTACWKLTVTGIGPPLSAHVHKGRAGENGVVRIPLGATYEPQGCVLIDRATLLAVGRAPRSYYVNVHTRKYSNGAIRGQLSPG